MPAVEHLGETVNDGDAGQALVRGCQFLRLFLKLAFDLDPYRDIADHLHDECDLPVFDDGRADAVNVPHLSVGKRYAALMIDCHRVPEHRIDTAIRASPSRKIFGENDITSRSEARQE